MSWRTRRRIVYGPALSAVVFSNEPLGLDVRDLHFLVPHRRTGSWGRRRRPPSPVPGRASARIVGEIRLGKAVTAMSFMR